MFAKDVKRLSRSFRRGPSGSSAEELLELRRAIVKALHAVSPSELEDLWSQGMRTALPSLMSSGMRDSSRKAEDELLFSELSLHEAAKGGYLDHPAALVSAMLLAQNFEVPIAERLRVPAWLQKAYTHFVFDPVNVLSRVGDAETVFSYIDDLTRVLHGLVIRKEVTRCPIVDRLRSAYVRQMNFTQAYFSAANLRLMYQRRGDLISADLIANGAQTLRAIVPKVRPKIRLGIFAQHFGPQTETYFTLSHFGDLDRERFDIRLYSMSSTNHPLEQKCIQSADDFIVLPPDDLAEQVRTIRDDDLDILMIGTNMTAVLNTAALLGAFRMAPIQIATVSSPVTTGAHHIDVLLSAEWNEPDADRDEHYTERLELLPGAVNYYAYQFDNDPATVSFDRADLGISKESVVMFSGANFFKITPELSRTWTRILAAVPNSVLLLMPFGPNWSARYREVPFRERIDEQLREVGVDPGRVKIVSAVPSRRDVHEILSTCQLYLDGFPFAGACSMLDPIITAVPPIVWSGANARSNHGAALLRLVGLEQLICRSEDEYVATAVSLATNAPERARISTALRALAKRHPPVYFDTGLFASRVGKALESIYQRHLRRFSDLEAQSPAERIQVLQDLARSVVGKNIELNALTDTNIVTALIEPSFRALKRSAPLRMLDVGACFGDVALPLLKRGWIADLFEPNPDTREVLNRNTAGYRDSCRIHAAAVSSSGEREMTFHKSKVAGCSGLDNSPFAQTEALIRVPCIGLAQFCAEQNINSLDFIKVDAEGFDFDVLESLDFDKVSPRLILVEYGTHFPSQSVETINAAIQRMADRSYGCIIFNYEDDGNFALGSWIYRLTEIFIDESVPNLERNMFGNIVFYREGDTEFLLNLFSLLDICRRPTSGLENNI
jgi:FkbM family methyltransferase